MAPAEGAAFGVIDRGGLASLFDLLRARAYQIAGPRVRDGAVVYDRLDSIDDLPAGWSDEQDAGSYRLSRRNDGALFAYASGPHAWKRFLYPPSALLWRARKDGRGFHVEWERAEPARWAFLGVRACDLAAIAIQDRVFLEGPVKNAGYGALRERAFVVAVNCGHPARTCFCASMKTGPKAESGFDLALTEIVEPGRHEFLVEAGGDRGREVLAELPHRAAAPDDRAAGLAQTDRAASRMGRHLDTAGIKELLYRNLDHPRWSATADRCLACANCTMVCPTCFCSSAEDVGDLSGERAEHWRRWDSCFSLSFSYVHGGPVRASTRARYRQWATHKLATWFDQFGTSGCVGCGRCIAWCPAGIDITEEARAIRETDGAGPTPGNEVAHG